MEVFAYPIPISLFPMTHCLIQFYKDIGMGYAFGIPIFCTDVLLKQCK